MDDELTCAQWAGVATLVVGGITGTVLLHRSMRERVAAALTGEPAEPASYWPGIAVSAASGAVGWGLVTFGGG